MATQFSDEQTLRLAQAMEEWRRIMISGRGTRNMIAELVDALMRQGFELTDTQQ